MWRTQLGESVGKIDCPCLAAGGTLVPDYVRLEAVWINGSEAAEVSTGSVGRACACRGKRDGRQTI